MPFIQIKRDRALLRKIPKYFIYSKQWGDVRHD